jgi:glycosyltransferase involved in cell wall biosynthesis
MMVSIILPIYEEEKNIDAIHDRLIEALDRADFSYEVIFVDDGSTDGSAEKLEELTKRDVRFKLVTLRRNYGQTAAMMAGFDHASGDVFVAMDGDLQNDPKDITRLVAKIGEGYDVVSGWRMDRKDKPVRRLLSRCANFMISFSSGVKLHDFGCTLKAYRKEIISNIRLYGEMHRFIPIHAKWQGARIGEIPVSHHYRQHGRSKYGMERIFKVMLDLMLVLSFSTLANKPLYIFGGFGLGNLALSILGFCLMLYYKFWGGKSFVETPLPQLVVLFFLVGILSILLGFLAEILIRIYYESQEKPIYSVEKTHNLEERI